MRFLNLLIREEGRQGAGFRKDVKSVKQQERIIGIVNIVFGGKITGNILR